MSTINIKNPTFCGTLPINRDKHSYTYKELIKKGQWDKVEENPVFYSKAIEEYLACKQSGAYCGFKVPKPTTSVGRHCIVTILNTLHCTENDLFDAPKVVATNPAPKATSKPTSQKHVNSTPTAPKVVATNPAPKATSKPTSQKHVNPTPTAPKVVATNQATKVEQKAKESFEIPESVKKGIKDLLKLHISSEEHEIAYMIMDTVARTDKSIFDELNMVARELNLINAADVVVAMLRSSEAGIDASELEAFYKLLKKYGNPADIADIIIESMKPDSDDEVAAILTQITQDIINGIKKAGCIDEDTVNILSLVLPEDEVAELRKMATPSGVICLPDKGGAKKQQEQKQPATQKADKQEKAKPCPVVTANSDRKNGFVNHNLQTITNYPGCIDVVNFAASLGYSTKLTPRGDGFITAEVFAKGIQDPISKLIIDPGVLYPAAMGYAIMIPDGGTPFAPSFNDIIMSDYVYINDQQEQQQLAWMMAGNQPTRLWLDDLRTTCFAGKKLNAIIEYSSLQTMDQVTQFMLEQLANKLFEKGIRLRGRVIEIQQDSIKVEFKSNAGPLRRYYQNKKYGDIVITISLNSNNKVLFNASGNGNKKSVAKLNKLLG